MENTHIKVSIISVFRDEAKYLKEWIEFHLLVGVDEFHLVNNNSIDNYADILANYIESGIVKLYDLHVETKNEKHSRANEEVLVAHWISKLNELIRNSDSDWAIHVSADEFLFPTTSYNIKDVLNNFPNEVGEISVNWTLFGHNNITLKDNELLIEKLTKSSTNQNNENLHVKAIFRPQAVAFMPSVHYTQLKPGFIKTDATGNSQNFRSMHEVNTRVLEPMHINHYRFRDLAWTTEKLKMYELWGRGYCEDLANSYNDIDNYSVVKFVDELKTKMNFKK